jgi:hypothetical protein
MGEPTLYFSNLSSILSNSNNGAFDTMQNRDDFFDHFRPKSLVFQSAKDLCRSHCIKFYDDTNVLGDLWLANIGHALFDSVYAIFTGLIENNGMHTLPFRLISTRKRKDSEPWIQNVVNTIAPLGLVFGSKFFHQDGFDTIHLKTLLVPNYANCLMCESSDKYYGMPMGYELDAFRLLRQHIFTRFLLPPSPPRLKLPHGSLNAIAVQNKRFSSRDCMTIVSAFEYVFPNISGRFVDWGKVNGFRAQLEIISDTQIHLSGPGTGMMYQTFLPDGAVHVNLGNCALYNFQTSVWGALLSLIYPNYSKASPGYMDQCMVASTPYHRALYYPIAEACGGGMTRDGLVSLMNEASMIYDSEFEIPVPRGINLSPDGLVVQGLLRGDPLFREYLMDTVAHKSCSTGFYFWPEIIVRQVGGWATGECRLNVTLLGELKNVYNITY